MNKKDKQINKLSKSILYLVIIIVSFVGVVVALYYEMSTFLDICFGVFSGALIAVVSSVSLSMRDKDDEDVNDEVLALLQKLGIDHACCGVEIYQNTASDGQNSLDYKKLIASAQNRIWMLRTDYSNFIIAHKDDVLEVAKQRDLDIRILGMHPQNTFIQYRYAQINHESPEAMFHSIRNATEDLIVLRDNVNNLANNSTAEVRLYKSQPTVMLCIIDDKVIISHILNSNRISKSVHIVCSMSTCVDVTDDFVTNHFGKIWEEAQTLDQYQRTEKFKPEVVEINDTKLLNAKQKIGLASIIRCNAAQLRKNVGDFLREHLGKMWFPLASFLVAGIVLILMTTGVINEGMLDEKFFGVVFNSVLGLISGSIISVLEYVLEYSIEKRELADFDSAEEQRLVQMCQGIANLNGGEANNCGITIHCNRNAANIKEKIQNAKKRVWIYATNHRYIRSLEVSEYLKNNKLDVRFLMLNPSSIFVATRYRELPGKLSAQDFSSEISDNLSYLINEHQSVHNVQTRLFTNPPTFMMYLIDDTLILSYILRQGRASDQSIFVFDLQYPRVKLFTQDFVNHFLDTWENSEKISLKASKCVKTKFQYKIGKHKLYATLKNMTTKQ